MFSGCFRLSLAYGGWSRPIRAQVSVALWGVRLSGCFFDFPFRGPLVAQIIEADQFIAFEPDASGWYLHDRKAEKVFRSPIDGGGSGDIGYVAGLSCPDSRGTFLYIAGIHAAGSDGVIHYLNQNLAEVYRDVRTRRFSALVECEFDAQTR